ncbi:MAG: hypothetical protein QNJ55_15615 [Xenococcus sp. MO_188.B8]|nr:hypothetical protein [Xenococcus sp. MO_188.B8]
MLYNANKDIHTQFPCEELSISINVIDNNILHDQYSFDTEKSCLISKINASFSQLIINVGVAIGNENTIDLLRDLRRVSPLQHLRSARGWHFVVSPSEALRSPRSGSLRDRTN